MIKGKRIICLAQTNASAREVIVPEILKHLNLIIPGKYTYNKATNKITYKNGIIYLASYESLESLRGFTEISLCILDEAALAPADIFTIISFCMRGKNIEPRIILASTPRSDNWLTRYIKDNEIPIITAKTSDNKTISQEQLDLMKKTCVDENAWRREFYGEEVDDDSNGTIFTSDLISKASRNTFTDNEGYCIGIDCAGLGKDNNVILVRSQNKILEIIKKRVCTNAELCSIVKGLILKYDENKLSHIAIDEAYGLDLSERLTESNINNQLIAFGGKADKNVFANKRAEIYFELKNGIEEYGLEGITEELAQELAATKYLLNNSNKLQLIAKEDIKLNIGRSPDTADALALTYSCQIIPKAVFSERTRKNCYYMND